MIQDIIQTFRKPSADVMAQRELEENQRELLNSQRNRDYYAKLAEFYEVRIKTLNSPKSTKTTKATESK